MTDSLLSFLDERTVRARVQAADWRAAVERAGELLVAVEAVEPRYIDAMQSTIEEYGSYVVIAPGIALPHARPEAGVVRPALSLVTLADAVPFGHPKNDPIDVVLAFGAVDKTAHVQALQELARLLGDPAAVERIRAADSDEELLEALHGQGAGGRPAGDRSMDDDDRPNGRGR